MKMKVLHILDSLNRGGAEVMTLDVCRRAGANGLDLTLIATGGGDLEEDFRCSGVDFFRLQRRSPVDLRLIMQLRKIIIEREIQVIHCHQAVEALHAYIATTGMRTQRVLSWHGYIGDLKNRLVLSYLLPRMNANVAVSYELLNRFETEEHYDTSRNFHVIHNGVDAGRLRSSGRRLRAEMGITEDDILLGMVGNFQFAVKNQMTICKALPQLFGQSPRVHFAFIGGHSKSAPQSYNECVSFCRQQNIADRVHFLGKRADIPDVLNSLDIFVFSSLQEGLPIAVIEAMMIGLPIVVSDIGPLLEVSGNGTYATIFRRKDYDDLAGKLIALMNDPKLRANLGRQARQWSMQQFSIETHILKLIDLYNALACET
jgi:glycosyltransferase involved in cell wall biosynthesis